MPIRTKKIICGPAAGSSGSATATAISDEVINGLVLAVYVKYTDTPPATTDVTIQEAYNSPAMPILTLTDKNTDGWFQPMAGVEDTAGAAVTNATQQIPVCDKIKVTVAGANAGDGVEVTLRYVE